ncbi:MAG: protoporphyrinogen oxidase [Candidatus Sumerlaeia bacterium]|nr:protoporphyrinogen oxidase [Candidatus Sumerlaeia bacterium]
MMKQKHGTNAYDVVVLGAGISGLTVAHSLARAGRRVFLAEATNRTGGVFRSDKVDGYLLERGPNSFTCSPVVDELLREIGLLKRAIRRPLRDYDRFVYKNGRLHQVPTGPLDLLRTDCLTTRGKVKLISGLLRANTPPRSDLSLGEYFRPRIGDEAVDTLLRPFIAGVYAADADRLSFEASLPRLYNPATTHSRLIGAVRAMLRERRASAPTPTKGKNSRKALVSFPNGLEEFPRRLTRIIRKHGVDMELGRTFRIAGKQGETWELKDEDGNSVHAGKVVLAMPAGQTARALELIVPEVTEVLDGIRYAGLTVVHSGVSAWDVRAREKGFGFLNAQLPGEWHANPSARVRALGMIWSDQLFPGRAPTGMGL